MQKYKVPIQSLIDHIKTAIDVDPWAKEMAEELLKEKEQPETDFECLKRIFTKAKLITAFDEYEGMFDNKIIVFLNGNELHLNFDKNTEEIKEAN